jgi:hypothetical protein
MKEQVAMMKHGKEREYTINSLRDFLEGSGGEWDWDAYTGVSLKDPKLNAIRKRALKVELPLSDGGREELESLLKEALQIKSYTQ